MEYLSRMNDYTNDGESDCLFALQLTESHS